MTNRSNLPSKLGKPLWSTKLCIDGGGGGGGGADDKFVILLVKKGYGLVSAFSKPYRTRPEAGFTQIPGRIPFLQVG